MYNKKDKYLTISVTGSDDETRELVGNGIAAYLKERNFKNVELRAPNGYVTEGPRGDTDSIFSMIESTRPDLFDMEVVVSTTPQPMQPFYTDAHGVKRFADNDIIRHLTDTQTVSLNQVCVDVQRRNMRIEDQRQFWQQLGYSESGYGDLSFSAECAQADEEYRACRIAQGLDPDD